MPGGGLGTGQVRGPTLAEASQPGPRAPRPVALLPRGAPRHHHGPGCAHGAGSRGGSNWGDSGGGPTQGAGTTPPGCGTSQLRSRGSPADTADTAAASGGPLAELLPGKGSPFRFTVEAADRGPKPGSPCAGVPHQRGDPNRGQSPPGGLTKARLPGPRTCNSKADLGPPLLAGVSRGPATAGQTADHSRLRAGKLLGQELPLQTGVPRGPATASPQADQSRHRAGKTTRAQATTHAAAAAARNLGEVVRDGPTANHGRLAGVGWRARAR